MKTWRIDKLNKKEQKIWAGIFQKCAELIYERLAFYGWDQKFLGYQEGGI
jgi:hypothetical protein